MNETPTTAGCTLTTEAQQQLIFVQDDPLGNTLDGTFYLEPGEEVFVTFRVLPDTTAAVPLDPVVDFDVATLSGQVTSQPLNSDGSPQPPQDQFGPPPATPVSLWSAEGAATDSVGGNDGTPQNGAGFNDGRVGQAFSFDGTNQHVLVGDDPSLRLTGALTMAAWIYPTGPGSNPVEGGIIVNKEWAYEMARFTDGTIRWATGNGVNDFSPLSGWVNSGATAPLDTWTHVVVTYDQGVGTTYINGTQVHSLDIGVDNLGAGSHALRIGGRVVHSQYFDGRIDEVGLYDGALTAAEVLALYASAPPFIISSFDPSEVFTGTSPAQQAALNAAVGVTGHIVEDFEDLTLVSGLTITGGEFGLNIQSGLPNAIWDGTGFFVNQVDDGNGLDFTVTGGTTSFGIGMGDIDAAGVHLFVNGEDYGSIMNFANWVKLGDNVRDVFVRVDAAPGETINTVRIEQISGSFNDGIFFDHVTFSPPVFSVPGSAGGTAIGGAAGGTAPFAAGSLAAGESIVLTASGVVEFGGGPIGPDGNGAACPSNCLAPGLSAISLVARVGGGPWQFIGSGPTLLTATSAGVLEFGVNDNFFDDNTGAFDVTVTPVSGTSAFSVDFDRLGASSFTGNEYSDHGLAMGSSNCTTCSAYVCNECSPASASGADYLAINGTGAEVTMQFADPVSAAPTLATGVSVYVNDTEASVQVQTLDMGGGVLDDCANVFSGCAFASLSGNRVILTFPGPVAGVRFIDSGNDGHVVDDLAYTLLLLP